MASQVKQYLRFTDYQKLQKRKNLITDSGTFANIAFTKF